MKRIDRGLSIGRGMGLEDMAIVSRLAVVLAGKGYLKSHRSPGMCLGSFPLSLGVTEDTSGDPIVPDEMYFENADGSFKLAFSSHSIGSGALDAYRRTLKGVNKLTKNPMGVVDDLAELPFKAVDKVRGVKSSGDYYADHMANWSKQPGGIYHGGPEVKVGGSHKVYPSEGGYVYKAPNGNTYWYDTEEKALDHRRQMTEFEGGTADWGADVRREIAKIHGIGSGLGFQKPTV